MSLGKVRGKKRGERMAVDAMQKTRSDLKYTFNGGGIREKPRAVNVHHLMTDRGFANIDRTHAPRLTFRADVHRNSVARHPAQVQLPAVVLKIQRP